MTGTHLKCSGMRQVIIQSFYFATVGKCKGRKVATSLDTRIIFILPFTTMFFTYKLLKQKRLHIICSNFIIPNA